MSPRYYVATEEPQGRAGDSVHVEAIDADDASAKALAEHPGWRVVEVTEVDA